MQSYLNKVWTLIRIEIKINQQPLRLIEEVNTFLDMGICYCFGNDFELFISARVIFWFYFEGAIVTCSTLLVYSNLCAPLCSYQVCLAHCLKEALLPWVFFFIYEFICLSIFCTSTWYLIFALPLWMCFVDCTNCACHLTSEFYFFVLLCCDVIWLTSEPLERHFFTHVWIRWSPVVSGTDKIQQSRKTGKTKATKSYGQTDLTFTKDQLNRQPF